MNKKHRLKSNLDFKKVFLEGKSAANRQFVIYVLPNQEVEYRIGISISKKLGNAVVRNRLKRQVRSIIQEKADQILPKQDIVIIGRKPILEQSYQEMAQSLYHALRRAGVLSRHVKRSTLKGDGNVE
ncbi:ribonuclease P protein component [Rubeoparvulum massiliense]|uniref:ribonuclease P protein component n=1 Tax=Rubeoparvulum massiliense TaxID=1631346 RepID=UPI00065E54EA|nr:ribonuclease P protein component [Rubeoparvulum massiliense]